jgi:hypothetical protein
MSWPPFRETCAQRALVAFGGDRLIVIGDVRFIAEQVFNALLASEWTLVECIPLPTWPGYDDAVRLYARAAGSTPSA